MFKNFMVMGDFSLRTKDEIEKYLEDSYVISWIKLGYYIERKGKEKMRTKDEIEKQIEELKISEAKIENKDIAGYMSLQRKALEWVLGKRKSIL